MLRRGASLRRRFPAYTVLSPAHFRLAPSAADYEATSAAPAVGSTTTYEFLLKRLYQVNRFTAVKLGIDNMKQLNAAFGDPAAQFEIVHVAGTNGKGSVSLKVAKALERSGYRTGLFVSPHVSCFRERIQINGELISEEQVCEHLSQIFNVSAQLRIPATFFEITTMLAFQHFAKQNVDCVVLETGLGGRLDATNVVNPAVSVITSIGMDHTRILGDSIDKIAWEKAGIIKPSTPVVIGPNVPVNVMQSRADEVQAPLVRVNAVGDFEDDYNEENSAIAREVCAQLNALSHAGHLNTPLLVDLDSQRIQTALSIRPPCRFQVLHIVRPNSTEKKVTIVLDVAHNLPAFERLVRSLRKRFPTQRFRFVCGFSADKDISKVLSVMGSLFGENESLATVYSKVHLVKANHPRGASLEEINLSIKRAGVPMFNSISSISEGVNDAIAAARTSTEDEVVVVCGSVFLMAEARQALGFKEPVDSPAINAVAGVGLSTPETRLAATGATLSINTGASRI